MIFMFISVRYVPTWFPGTSLLRRAKEAKAMINRVVDEPYQQVKGQKVRCPLINFT